MVSGLGQVCGSVPGSQNKFCSGVIRPHLESSHISHIGHLLISEARNFHIIIQKHLRKKICQTEIHFNFKMKQFLTDWPDLAVRFSFVLWLYFRVIFGCKHVIIVVIAYNSSASKYRHLYGRWLNGRRHLKSSATSLFGIQQFQSRYCLLDPARVAVMV